MQKTEIIRFRVTPGDRKLVKEATLKYHKETGAKVNMSKAIRHSLKVYTGKE
jgi:hypothetical protein